MKIAIIRSCNRDDMQGELCYRTMKFHKVVDKYIFWHECPDSYEKETIPNYKLSEGFIFNTNEEIIYRRNMDNFGGLSRLKVMMKDIKYLPVFDGDDYIVWSDSDIIMNKNPFNFIPIDTDHAGIFSMDEKYMLNKTVPHISGQFNIIKGWLWNKYIAEGQDALLKCYSYLENFTNGKGCADDTIFSIYSSYFNNAKLFSLDGLSLWNHHKVNQSEYNHEINKLK